MNLSLPPFLPLTSFVSGVSPFFLYTHPFIRQVSPFVQRRRKFGLNFNLFYVLSPPPSPSLPPLTHRLSMPPQSMRLILLPVLQKLVASWGEVKRLLLNWFIFDKALFVQLLLFFLSKQEAEGCVQVHVM